MVERAPFGSRLGNRVVGRVFIKGVIASLVGLDNPGIVGMISHTNELIVEEAQVIPARSKE